MLNFCLVLAYREIVKLSGSDLINMNALLKLLPLIFSKQGFAKNKKWIVILTSLAGAYQLLSPNGVGADWGIPSYDTFYQEPRDV